MYHAPRVPVVLVGTKSDLRDDIVLGKQAISKDKAAEFARSIKAASYQECSAITQTGLKELFDEAIRVGLAKSTRPQKNYSCTIM